MSNLDSKTNGRNKAHVEKLYRAVRECIDASYLTGKRYPNGGREVVPHDDPRSQLRDYVTNQAMLDKFDDLIDQEAVHERRHRNGAPRGFKYPISVKQSATAMVLGQLANGADLASMPGADMWLSYRDTAAEAIVIGFLARERLKAYTLPGGVSLMEALHLLDYAQAVRS